MTRFDDRPNQSEGDDQTAAAKQKNKQDNSNPNQGSIFGKFEHFHAGSP